MSRKIIFACDLDNTLIHSKSRLREGDICVELLNGAEQSYITPETERLIREVTAAENVLLLPVTTRSEEQYKRIQWAEGCTPELALVCNGTVLLRNGEHDKAWDERSEVRTEPYRAEFERLVGICSERSCFRLARIVDGMFVFAHFHEGEDYAKITAELAELTELDTQLSGRKLYFFPKFANKGAALAEFAQEYGQECRTVAAGDSMIDISMLNIAGTALVPDENLAEQLKNGDIQVCPEGEYFSEFILRYVLRGCS